MNNVRDHSTIIIDFFQTDFSVIDRTVAYVDIEYFALIERNYKIVLFLIIVIIGRLEKLLHSILINKFLFKCGGVKIDPSQLLSGNMTLFD